MLYLTIQRETGNSLIKQIFEQTRELILHEELKAGDKLPSTREMARLLNVSRNTVLEAYEMLVAEGYLSSKAASGYFIAEGAHYATERQKVADYNVTAYTERKLTGATISFDSGNPALDLFPRHKWNKAARQIFDEAPASALGYDIPQGRPELRNALAAYLRKTRGLVCHPDQLMITTGAKQGLTLIAKCLLHPESEVWIEDPTNRNVRQIFSYHTTRITPIAVDQDGIRPELFPTGGNPSLIFVTPSHQFPLGGMLPIQRRIELVRFAREHGCYIIEDDYDSEFRYRGLPLDSLHNLDNDSVIYVGTFSKTLFPSLRLGYLILPVPLMERFREWKRLGDHHSNSLSQLTLMRFMENGELERHIARMKKVYRQRRDFLIASLQAFFPNQVRIMGEKAGMHIVAEFPGVVFSPRVLAELAQAGVELMTVADHAVITAGHQGRIILGYSHLTPEEITGGLQIIRQTLTQIAAATAMAQSV